MNFDVKTAKLRFLRNIRSVEVRRLSAGFIGCRKESREILNVFESMKEPDLTRKIREEGAPSWNSTEPFFSLRTSGW